MFMGQPPRPCVRLAWLTLHVEVRYHIYPRMSGTALGIPLWLLPDKIPDKLWQAKGGHSRFPALTTKSPKQYLLYALKRTSPPTRAKHTNPQYVSPRPPCVVCTLNRCRNYKNKITSGHYIHHSPMTIDRKGKFAHQNKIDPHHQICARNAGRGACQVHGTVAYHQRKRKSIRTIYIDSCEF